MAMDKGAVALQMKALEGIDLSGVDDVGGEDAEEDAMGGAGAGGGDEEDEDGYMTYASYEHDEEAEDEGEAEETQTTDGGRKSVGGGTAGGESRKPKVRRTSMRAPSVRKKRTAYDKKMRQSGKNTQKPYISSSMGDMCRLMIRMACTENTLNMTEPPPVEFYDYWHKFKVTESKDKIPANYVDTRKVSLPKLKMNTSSFELFAKAVESAVSLHQHVFDTEERKVDHLHILNPALSDLWRGVRTSMSSESFISSSTKVSEPHWEVPLEVGWSDEDEEDVAAAALSDSDDEAGTSRSTLGGQGQGVKPQQGEREGQGLAGETQSLTGTQMAKSKAGEDSVMSIQSIGAKQRKEMGAVAASILHMEMEEARMAMESALKGDLKDRDLIDHFMEDLDDSFLIDSISYGQLPDAAFTPDFDYFNEDPVYKAKQLEKERLLTEALLEKQGGRRNKKEKKEVAKKGKKVKRKSDRVSSDMTTEGSESGTDVEALEKDTTIGETTPRQRTDYRTCLQNQKRRIEARIQSAARARSPMGSYRVPPGGQPLARTFDFKTPGPAAYSPNLNAVKPGPKGVFLGKRWGNDIYDTPGPGPAGYAPECRKCTAQMLNLHESERFETSESVGPGPGEYDVTSYAGTGKGKPQAILLSRRPEKNIGCGGSMYTNCFGVNRFGRRNPPKALIVGRYEERTKRDIGPGEYDPYVKRDTRVGISIKSRIPPLEDDESPGFLDLPPLFGDTPGKSIGLRKFQLENADSPGPIYLLPSQEPKPVTMTFRPFPSPGRDEEPSPLHYGQVPGEQCIKAMPAAPRPLIYGSHDLKYGIDSIPGPNKYTIKKCSCKIGIKMKGRYGTTSEVLPGPAEYTVKNADWAQPPRAVFMRRHRDKELGERSPGFAYTPKRADRVKGGSMYGRWKEAKEEEEDGPDFVDLFGFTQRGKYSKIPISLKSRHSPFVHSHIADAPQTPKTGCFNSKHNK